MDKEFEKLITSIDNIVKKKAEEDIAKAARYNVFKVIHMTSNETSVHSAFIADLLNPCGMHDCGSIFLDAFVGCLFKDEKTSIRSDFDFCTTQVKVQKEKNIGPVSEDQGGRLDIVITDTNGKEIIIENKIYAQDQDRQLLRYYNYAESLKKDYCLLYLTLDGHNASSESSRKLEENKDYFSISYLTHIRFWLEECLTLSKDKPLLCYGITHYLNLVRKLTHTDMDTKFIDDLVAQVLNEEVDHVSHINDYIIALQNSKRKLLKNFWEEIQKEEYWKNDSTKPYLGKDSLSVFYYNNGDYKKKNIKEIATLCDKFKFEEERKNKQYEYLFGVQVPIRQIKEGKLMLGLILDGAISIRTYVIASDDENKMERLVTFPKNNKPSLNLPKSDERADKWVKESNCFISAYYLSDNNDEWSFWRMPDNTLKQLSDMKQFVKKTVNLFNEKWDELRKISADSF